MKKLPALCKKLRSRVLHPDKNPDLPKADKAIGMQHFFSRVLAVQTSHPGSASGMDQPFSKIDSLKSTSNKDFRITQNQSSSPKMEEQSDLKFS
jgi:hypothetical protein